MGTAAVVLGCALWSASLGPASDLSYINEREFQIPITLPEDPGFLAEIEQLFLYVSTDEGKTWRQEAVASPHDKYFPFYARQDGAYWFNVAVQNKAKRTFPADISSVPPALKVVVDTKRPLVKFLSTDRFGDQVTVSWDIQDENLDLNSCRLEYSTGEPGLWHSVPLPAESVTGKKTWTVSHTGKVTVRMTVSDLAGNVTTATADLGSGSEATALGQPPAPMSPGRPPQPTVDSPYGSGWQAYPSPAEPPRPTPLTARTESTTRTSRGWPTPAGTEEAAPPRVIASTKAPPAPPTWTAAPPIMPTSAPMPPVPPGRSRSATAPLQYTNQLQIDLDYEAKAGPSGLGEVELWLTQDEGQTWKRYANDPDLVPPLSIELPGEGSYGFLLTLRSKGGIYKNNKQAPLPGDTPELRVEVDLTPPEAELYAVEADPRKKDSLFLQWKATDKNLSPRPITLKWAETPGGDWHDIASDLPNTGRYEWVMPSNLPFRIYLRLEVRDLAGNVGIAETDQPVLVDLVEPDGGLIGIVKPDGAKPKP
jgi:hypothetical protein